MKTVNPFFVTPVYSCFVPVVFFKGRSLWGVLDNFNYFKWLFCNDANESAGRILSCTFVLIFFPQTTPIQPEKSIQPPVFVPKKREKRSFFKLFKPVKVWSVFRKIGKNV